MKTFLTTTALIALALPALADIKIGASISATCSMNPRWAWRQSSSRRSSTWLRG